MMRKGRSWTELMWKGVQGSYALLQIVSFSAAARQRSRSTLHLSNLKTNKSTLFNEGDTQQSSTDKPVAPEFPIELEFRNVGF